VWEFGTTVETAMDEAEKRAGTKASVEKKNRARQAALDGFLFTAREEAKGRFRDPASVMKRGTDGDRRPDREHPWNDQD
jgi:hypothetical protein